ncbi:hypothetical protein GGR52DRAFT_456512 [Hypoxylon sp. FL1284]|nr:hypothetical protein GGR52DRAFT_456512 [Hypoxylon sp. FL1284]
MDRDSQNPAGVLAAKSNGNSNANANSRGGSNPTQPLGNRRPSKKSTVKHESKENITSDTDASNNTSSRHPLYSSPRYIRYSNSSSASSADPPESPRETRIPLPTSFTPALAPPNRQNRPAHLHTQSLDMRQPMNLQSAFALAEKQEAGDESDSTFNIKQAFNMASAEMNGRIDGSPSPAPRHLRRQSYGAASQGALASRPNGDLGSRLQQFDRNHKLGGGSGPLNGLFGKARVGPKVAETRDTLARKASDGSLRESPARRRDSVKMENMPSTGPAVGRPDFKKSDRNVPIPSIEYESASDERISPKDQVARISPEKSHNWQLDADFTAGDLQVSDSPRIRTAQSNGRISRGTSSASSSPIGGTPNLRRSNNRLDQIRQKEIEAAKAVLPEESSSLSRRTNSRIEEVRAREIESLSRRAVASSRLDEIRVRNSEARSESPETERSSNRQGLWGSSLELEKEPAKTPDTKTSQETKQEHVSDTPATVFRGTGDLKPNDAPKGEGDGGSKTEDKAGSKLPGRDSHDLLRRLARATSASPPADKVEQHAVPDAPLSNGGSESREDSRSRLTREEKRRSRNLEAKSSRERPTVGFAGLRRGLSDDSLKEKRNSQHGSEIDPTDRIEAELKLFAPLDNYSEKGSVRAPSPLPSEPEEDTPRPNRVDPLMQPTPRVTGAYVETPATVKVKQENGLDDQKPQDNLGQSSIMSRLHTRSSSEPSDKAYATQDSENTKRPKALMPRSSSAPTPPRRPRSALRRRRTLRPLVNTAKVPSVKDDIRDILRTNQIEDSTLDDFDSIIEDQDIDDEELKQLVDDTIHKIDDDIGHSGLSERDRELQVYDRMSKSLRTGLLGIRSAKKGIERLEDKVMHTEHQADKTHTDLNGSSVKTEIDLPMKPSDPTSIALVVPALYRKHPKFKLTKFGLFVLVVSIWYTIESIFCFLYVPQYNCTEAVPCTWSPNEPYFPYAMPFMLDEWATGGKGRELTWKMGEEMGDVLAEASDWATGTDFTQLDEMYMNVWERERHRRRLLRRGLTHKWIAPADYKPRFPEWNAARLAREAAKAYDYEAEDESMGSDERLK